MARLYRTAASPSFVAQTFSLLAGSFETMQAHFHAISCICPIRCEGALRDLFLQSDQQLCCRLHTFRPFRAQDDILRQCAGMYGFFLAVHTKPRYSLLTYLNVSSMATCTSGTVLFLRQGSSICCMSRITSSITGISMIRFISPMMNPSAPSPAIMG